MIVLNSRNRTVNKISRTSLSAVMVNGRMVFPDVQGGTIVILGILGDDSEESRVLLHALSVVARQGATENRYLDAVLPNGVEVSLNSSHGGRPYVQSVADTLVFLPSQLPLCEGVEVGGEVTLRLKLPETCIDVWKGREETVVWVQGLKVATLTGKGRKKTCGNADFWVFSEPSGVEVAHWKFFLQGHGRGDYWHSHGVVAPKRGETRLRGKCLEWSGFSALLRFVYPAADLEIKTTIIDIQRL